MQATLSGGPYDGLAVQPIRARLISPPSMGRGCSSDLGDGWPTLTRQPPDMFCDGDRGAIRRRRHKPAVRIVQKRAEVIEDA